ncbi:ABC transporter substrate-binding protein [Leuconostoc garlicum]|uniref:ABC transporter substrate-binding protein n=1 Tax=Leuconostoc garlicum TaxID=255248 RepID=A0ABM6HTH1_9LACO|nr:MULTISPECIES: MetQ/NlpA family ABC transporter substrate-binding protein [Leuconostoc]AQN79533.1 ABC transporter substrate-binding protein [Leuconostoc garlicum]
MRKKTWIGLILASILVVGITWATVKQRPTNVITVGSVTSDADIWRHLAQSKQAKQLHLKIQVKEFTDGQALNVATAQGQVDVNAFQSYGYFDAFNKASKVGKLANLGTTYLEPMGIYSSHYHALKDLPDGATIAIAKDLADEARGLKLLADNGLITLAPGFGALDGLEKVTSNPKHFKFEEIDDTTGGRVVKDPKIAAVLMSNSISQASGLNVLKDALAYEHVNGHTRANINILATATKNQNNPTYRKLLTLYHDKASQAYIAAKYQGTKTEVNKPISYFKGEK